MEPGKASGTAEYTAALRADHWLHDASPVLEDVWAIRLLGPQLRASVEAGTLRAMLWERGLRPTQGHVVLRQRFADDALAKATARGTRQLAVLAAGLDSSCLRRDARLRVLEVDHPASQAQKRERLAALGQSLAGVEFQAVDFESEDLASELGRSSLSRAEPVFLTWLGVSMYLPVATAFEALASIRSAVASGSELVFDYPIPVEKLDAQHRALAHEKNESLARAGEPRISTYARDALARALAERGFEVVEDLGPAELDARYCAGRTDGFRANPENRVVHARAI